MKNITAKVTNKTQNTNHVFFSHGLADKTVAQHGGSLKVYGLEKSIALLTGNAKMY